MHKERRQTFIQRRHLDGQAEKPVQLKRVSAGERYAAKSASH